MVVLMVVYLGKIRKKNHPQKKHIQTWRSRSSSHKKFQQDSPKLPSKPPRKILRNFPPWFVSPVRDPANTLAPLRASLLPHLWPWHPSLDAPGEVDNKTQQGGFVYPTKHGWWWWCFDVFYQRKKYVYIYM